MLKLVLIISFDSFVFRKFCVFPHFISTPHPSFQGLAGSHREVPDRKLKVLQHTFVSQLDYLSNYVRWCLFGSIRYCCCFILSFRWKRSSSLLSFFILCALLDVIVMFFPPLPPAALLFPLVFPCFCSSVSFSV